MSVIDTTNINALKPNDSDLQTQDLRDNFAAINTAISDINTISKTSKAATITSDPIDGAMYFIDGTDGGWFKGVTGAAAATYTDNGASYCGTQFIPTGGDGSAAWVRVDGGYNVGLPYNAAWFGLQGDNSTDNSVPLQTFSTLITSNGLKGYLSEGIYLTSTTTDIEVLSTGWGFVGDGRLSTVIKCSTDNIPIFDIGNDGVNVLHTWFMEDIGFDYSNTQTGNTSAASIYFSAQDNFNVSLNRIKFSGGYWGIKVKSGVGGPWACSWNDLEWGSGVVGGAMDWSGAANAVPNNNWGRFGVDSKNMTEGTIFKEIKGYNNQWATLEVYGGSTNLRLISFQAGSDFVIGSIKNETITITGALAGNAMITCPANGSLQIGTMNIGGTTCILTPSTGAYIFSGNVNLVKVGSLVVSPSQAVTSFTVSSITSRLLIDTVTRDATYPIPFTNLGGTAAANGLTISSIANDQLSDDKGDSDYTVSLGEPTNIRYETTLTASRTVALPGVNDGDMFNGMRYRIITEGAVNGANTIVVQSEGNTKATLTADNTFVELMYRRHPTAHTGWKVIGKGTI